MTIRRISVLLLALCLSVGLCGCGTGSETGTENGLTIVTTVFPAYDFARQVAGEQANVSLLVPPGSEIHSFEPTPKDIVTIQSCDLLVCNGGESEAWLEEILAGAEGHFTVLRMMDCVPVLEEELGEGMEAEEKEAEEDGPEMDEHVWTSPVNARLICGALADTLSQIDPDHASDYARRQQEYDAQLEELDGEFRTIVDTASRRTLVFADRFPVRYFVEEYGLAYAAAFPGCAEDTEPSAATVAALVDKVQQEQIPVVLTIEFSNGKMADVICEATGCGKLQFHSCHNISAEDMKAGVTYLQLMENNEQTLKEALN